MEKRCVQNSKHINNELSHIIYQYGLLCNSGTDILQDHTENDLDIDLYDFDTCDINNCSKSVI